MSLIMENDTCTKMYILSEIFNISVIQLGTGLKTIAHLAISQIVMKNFIKFCLIIKECPEEILMKLAIVLKISKF